MGEIGLLNVNNVKISKRLQSKRLGPIFEVFFAIDISPMNIRCNALEQFGQE